MELMDISYHKEVAAGLLQIQQAMAKLEAREKIVEGSVTIVCDAVKALEMKGVRLNEKEKAELVRSLMIMTISD